MARHDVGRIDTQGCDQACWKTDFRIMDDLVRLCRNADDLEIKSIYRQARRSLLHRQTFQGQFLRGCRSRHTVNPNSPLFRYKPGYTFNVGQVMPGRRDLYVRYRENFFAIEPDKKRKRLFTFCRGFT